jgi:L-lactate dehydrogenase
VFSTGTLIDSLRFRVHLADRLRVRPRDVQAMVVGEHGTSEVLLWSSASVGGIPVLELLGQSGQPLDRLKQEIENDIRYANITIIEGTGASSTASGPCRRAWPRRCCATSALFCRWPPTRHATR